MICNVTIRAINSSEKHLFRAQKKSAEGSVSIDFCATALVLILTPESYCIYESTLNIMQFKKVLLSMSF